MSAARTSIVAFAVVLVLGIAGIVVAGLHQRRGTAFSTQSGAGTVVGTLGRGQTVCQTPVALARAAGSVVIWTRAVPPAGTLTAAVGPAGGGTTLHAALRPDTSLPAVPYGIALRARLPRTLASGPTTVCIHAAAPADLLGGAVTQGSGALRLGGRTSGLALALVFDSPHPGSVLSQLSRTLRRAALFHPAWVGAWTFWVLLGLLAAATVLLGLGLAGAARAEPEDHEMR